jgi:hypothetical protein
MSFIKVLALSLYVASASAACTREALTATRDNFLKSSIEKAGAAALTLAPNVRISQNNVVVKSVSDTAYANITGYYKPWRVQSIDSGDCQIATFFLANQGADPALVSIRIKTDGEGKAIQELEVLNVLKGSHMFFAPQMFPNEAPAMWSSNTDGGLSREKLIEIANTYPSGIQAGDGKDIPGAPTCPRIENGVQTTTNCNKGLAIFKQPVRDRRWVADTVTGVVLGGFYFDKPANIGAKFGLWLNEYFKIDNGKLAGIQAAMKELQGVPFVDVWGPKGREA